MTGRRVVITGVGAVSAAGLGGRALYDAACAGAAATRTVQSFDASGFASTVGGEIADFSARNYVPKSYRKAVKLMARDIEIAVAAADFALRDAGLVTKGIDESAVNIDGERFACSIGAGLICAELDELGAAMQTSLDDAGRFDLKRWGEGMNNLTPLWLLKYLPNMLSCHVTIIHDLRGPSNAITCSEASALLSVGEAFRQVARNDADGAIAGGAESRMNPMGFLRQSKLGRLVESRNDRPQDACRPFDRDHDGTVVGEGGGLVILEEMDLAQSRGASAYAELVGFAAAADPNGADPDCRHCGNVGAAAAKALRDAGIGPEQLGLIVAQGSGVPYEDELEARAIREALGDVKAPVVSITGLVGDCYAGAGGLALATAAWAMREQRVPASANFSEPAEGCAGLNVPSQSRDADIQYALVQSFAYNGQSAAVVLKRWERRA